MYHLLILTSILDAHEFKEAFIKAQQENEALFNKSAEKPAEESTSA